MIDTNLIHEVHGSELTAFRHCRLQHEWSFSGGYSSPVQPAPLEFGSAFHVGMETFWSPETWYLPLKELYAHARDAFIAECERQRTVYLQRLEQYALDPEAKVDYETRVVLGKGMLRKFVCTVDRKAFTPVAVEQEAFVPIYDDKGNQVFCRCNGCQGKYIKRFGPIPGKIDPSGQATLGRWTGLPVYYGIRVDAMLQDREGGYWIVDWKTTAQLLKDQTILELDGQVGSYCWAIMRELNLDVRGFKYVQIFKGFPNRPKLLQRSMQGRWYSVAKQQRTDFETYMRHVRKYDLPGYEAGFYDEYLYWLKENAPDFVRWFTVHKTGIQLDNIGNDIRDQILDLLAPHRVYPSSSRIQCQMCHFQEPCLERQSGGDYQDILNTQYVQGPPYYVVQREMRRK
jgi:hypothetical protein